MLRKGKFSRDPFTFSLGGMTTIASFVFPPAVADDEINDRIKGQINGRSKGRIDDTLGGLPRRAIPRRPGQRGLHPALMHGKGRRVRVLARHDRVLTHS